MRKKEKEVQMNPVSTYRCLALRPSLGTSTDSEGGAADENGCVVVTGSSLASAARFRFRGLG